MKLVHHRSSNSSLLMKILAFQTSIFIITLYSHAHNEFRYNRHKTVYLKKKEKNISFLLFLAEISINQIKSDTIGIMYVFQSWLNKLAISVAEIPNFS